MNRAALLQLASVVASAGAAIFAKFSLSSLSLAQFLLIFAATSVVVCAPLVDRNSVRLFLAAPAGWFAIASNAVALSAFYFGLNGLDPGTHAFLSRTYVVFGFALSHLMFRESFGPSRQVLAVLCMLSALLIAAPTQMVVGQWLAAAATILAAFLYAFNYALLRTTPQAVSPATAIFLYNAALLPLALTQVDLAAIVQSITVRQAGLGIISSILSVLSLYWYLASMRQVTFFLSTALRAASPFMVALMAVPWFPMALTTANMIGVLTMPCVLVIIAVMEHRNSRI